ncbi:fibronectin type III domain-containing protein [Anaerobutyricum hallii]|uniref:fibronectin type III domain-containing protein n=1 Tax=Anaerobutyricum hallii TaxID=39488 RepID=UPI003A89856E
MKQRTMNITRNIICILGLLTLIILIKPTKVCAFSMNDAKSSPVLNSGKYRTSRLRDEYDVKLFQVKMPERGYFRITLRPDAFANLDDIVDGWNFSIYRKDDLSDPVASYWEIETKMSTEKLVLAKGTYYIAVESWSSYEAPRACFNIKADIVSDNSWEKENNDTLKKADAITIGKKYQGTLFDNMDEDCFKVTAPNTGKITATLQCDPDTDVNYIEDGWNMAIYSANNSEDPIIKEEGIVTKGSIKFNVTKGKTYYIHVYNYDLGAPLGYVYHLSTSFKGPKVTSVKKNTTTAKKTVKMVTGVSLKVKKKKINIHFKLISNVSKYQIMYSTKKSFKNKKVVTVKSGNVTIKKLKRKKTYFVRIRAISKNGKAGAWSVVKKVRVK